MRAVVGPTRRRESFTGPVSPGIPLAELLDLAVVLLDLECDLGDVDGDGVVCRRESWRHHWPITARTRFAKQRVVEAGIRWPQNVASCEGFQEGDLTQMPLPHGECGGPNKL